MEVFDGDQCTQRVADPVGSVLALGREARPREHPNVPTYQDVDATDVVEDAIDSSASTRTNLRQPRSPRTCLAPELLKPGDVAAILTPLGR